MIQPLFNPTHPVLFEPEPLCLEGDWWDLNGTIHEYSYLTHNFFRYYGKFPSALARRVIGEFVPAGTRANIIDSYSGCGTTLVEAMLAGHNAIGTDINPLEVSAASVKTGPLDEQQLWKAFRAIMDRTQAILANDEINYDAIALSRDELAKWFPDRATPELFALREAIYELNNSPVKDFYLLAFTAIIRRVSTAFDAEVRPHFNKNKPIRLPTEAFVRKTADMTKRLQQFSGCIRPENRAMSYLADNRALSHYNVLEPASFDLALTHPPYLNCFDYIPVYRLELQWADDLARQWSLSNHNLIDLPEINYEAVRNQETHSWPATPKVIEKYRQGNLAMLQQLWLLLRHGAVCCVVIGDSTMKGILMPVHQWFIDMGIEAGFHHHRTIYRTTHYGTGKYAYETRSHYHGAAEKRDAILVFKKL